MLLSFLYKNRSKTIIPVYFCRVIPINPTTTSLLSALKVKRFNFFLASRGMSSNIAAPPSISATAFLKPGTSAMFLLTSR